MEDGLISWALQKASNGVHTLAQPFTTAAWWLDEAAFRAAKRRERQERS